MFHSIRFTSAVVAVAWLFANCIVPCAAEDAAPAPSTPLKKAVRARPPKADAAPVISEERILEMAKASGLTSEVVRTGVEYIVKYKPRLAKDLDTTLKADSQQFKSQVSNAASYARDLAALKRSDPTRYDRREQMLQLDAQVERFVDRYQEVSEGEKPQVEVEMTTVLAKVFDLRTEEDRYQLEQVKKQADAMQAKIADRVKNKDRIVDRQMTTMLGLNEALTW
jgi:hypothetical protein